MGTNLTISDELAAALEAKQAGMPSIDAAAEALPADAMAAEASDADDRGLSAEASRALIAAGEASGSVVAWDAQVAREDLRRRFAARQTGWTATASC